MMQYILYSPLMCDIYQTGANINNFLLTLQGKKLYENEIFLLHIKKNTFIARKTSFFRD